MHDFGATILACTPYYALYLAEEGVRAGIDFSSSSLKIGIFGAEPWSERMRTQLEEKLGISAHDIYGLSEVLGPGVSMECSQKQGMHVHEDHFIAEIIDPNTGKQLPLGQQGELVFTSLTKEAFPVIRYRTRDITTLVAEPCPCGRTHLRMKRVTGRTDDMLIIRGVNVFPSQIESVLLEFGDTEPCLLYTSTNFNTSHFQNSWMFTPAGIWIWMVKGYITDDFCLGTGNKYHALGHSTNFY